MIPAKLPGGTTREQWERYEAEKIAHDARYESLKPHRELYFSDEEYRRDFSQWSMDEAMSDPNKPGYYRANND
jgi:hypothetical protein